MGFAVVADEVNKLAAQSQSAAKSINQLLTEIETKTLTSTKTAAKAHQIAMEQLDAVQQTQRAFDDITKAMRILVSHLSEVDTHLQGINDVKDQTLQAILNINSISEETAASSQEVAAAIEEQTAVTEEVGRMANQLQKMSEELVSGIVKFRIEA